MIEISLVICFNSNPAYDTTAEETIAECKYAEKYAILTLIFF